MRHVHTGGPGLILEAEHVILYHCETHTQCPCTLHVQACELSHDNPQLPSPVFPSFRKMQQLQAWATTRSMKGLGASQWMHPCKSKGRVLNLSLSLPRATGFW